MYISLTEQSSKNNLCREDYPPPFKRKQFVIRLSKWGRGKNIILLRTPVLRSIVPLALSSRQNSPYKITVFAQILKKVLQFSQFLESYNSETTFEDEGFVDIYIKHTRVKIEGQNRILKFSCYIYIFGNLFCPTILTSM